MEDSAQNAALIESFRSIIGAGEDTLSTAQILKLLQQAEGDLNKAVDLYFQMNTATQEEEQGGAGATNVNTNESVETSETLEPTKDSTPTVVSTNSTTTSEQPFTWENELKEIKELLGNDAQNDKIRTLLEQTNGNLQEAVDLYFSGENEQEQINDPIPHVQVNATAFDLPQEIEDGSRIQNIAAISLSPPSSPAAAEESASNITPPPAPIAAGAPCPPGVYEVTLTSENFNWEIGSVFGRAVVLSVTKGGPAEKAGIVKSDVLISCNGAVVTEQNAAQYVDKLAKKHPEENLVLRFRRASHDQPQKQQPQSREEEVEEDAGSVGDDKEAKHGLQVLAVAINKMIETIDDHSGSLDVKLLVDLLIKAEFNMEVAVNNYFNDHRLVPDLREIFGFDWDPVASASSVYKAEIPAGPLGLTVENILERTIVVDLKAGGAAEKAQVKRSSWLVGVNGKHILRMTHKDTLRLIETAKRPLQLELVQLPAENYRLIRKQLSMNVRQQKTERPIPEQDRMSFRVFQLKIHQLTMVFPKTVCLRLTEALHLEEEGYDDDEEEEEEEKEDFGLKRELASILEKEKNGEVEGKTKAMSNERRFLLNLFATIHEYEDKGESVVMRTIHFLGLLGAACAKLLATTSKEQTKEPSRDLLLLNAILHVLESLSIIENHATWDAMVDALKRILKELRPTFVSQIYVPMVSRLSISPSPTARIVPISLLSLLYPVVSGDVCVQLRGMTDRMCLDDNPLVRRAVTSITGDLASAVGVDHDLIVWWFVQLVEKTSNDTHDIVRIFAVKSCLALAKVLASSPSDQEGVEAEESKRLVLCQMLPMVNTFVSDSSWQVRLETARLLPELCQVFGNEYSDVFVDHFVAMVKDSTVEVRSACAQAMYELGHVLIELARKQMAYSQVDDISSKLENLAVSDHSNESSVDSESRSRSRSSSVASNGRDLVAAARTKIIRSVLPATYKMSTDISVNVRLALAKSVGQCLQLVGENSYQELVPLFSQFLEDKDANVRAAVVEAMARYCLNSSSLIDEMIFPAIKNLISSTQWRIRAMSVECICAYAERTEAGSGSTLLPEELSETCLKMLLDPVYEVRKTTCSKLPALAKALGDEWVIENAMPSIIACMEQSFHGKVAGLLAFEALAEHLVKVNKIEEVVDLVIKETQSKTANLRFRALRTLGFLVERLRGDAKPFVDKIREMVIQRTDKEQEPDADVRETAEKVLAQLKNY